MKNFVLGCCVIVTTMSVIYSMYLQSCLSSLEDEMYKNATVMEANYKTCLEVFTYNEDRMRRVEKSISEMESNNEERGR